jgi:hypothetical protein
VRLHDRCSAEQEGAGEQAGQDALGIKALIVPPHNTHRPPTLHLTHLAAAGGKGARHAKEDALLARKQLLQAALLDLTAHQLVQLHIGQRVSGLAKQGRAVTERSKAVFRRQRRGRCARGAASSASAGTPMLRRD